MVTQKMDTLKLIVYSSFGATVLVGAVMWLARNLILTRLQNSVRHEFDAKLEKIKAELHSKEAEIAAIRETALAAARGRNTEIAVRKLQAIDELWEGFHNAKKYLWTVMSISTLKLDNVAKELGDPRMQKFLSAMSPAKERNAERISMITANRARPWVSELAWAYFSAYSAMIGYCIMWFETAKLELDPGKFIDSDGVYELLHLALPDAGFDDVREHKNFRFGDAAQQIELKLIAELKDDASGKKADARDVERAQKIAEAARGVNQDSEKANQEVSKSR